MEAKSHRFGGIFTNYNGSILTQSMRSTRGKGELNKKQSICEERLGFFELLATVAGEFLQNDGVIRKNNDNAKQKNLKNDKPLVINTKPLSHIKVSLQKCSNDSIDTCFLPQNIKNLIFCQEKNGIEISSDCCCAKLSKYNSLLLHELPIPSFVKNIVVYETTHQDGYESLKEHDDQFKISLEFQDTMMMNSNQDNNNILNIMDERIEAFENRNLYCALHNANEYMYIDQTKDNSLEEVLNGSKQFLLLNQSHDSICESHNPFYKLEVNIDALNDIGNSNYCIQNNKLRESRDFLVRESNTNFDPCFTNKVDFQYIENNWRGGKLKTMEENQSSTLESMVIDEIHLDCSKDHEMLDCVENAKYINSKLMKKHVRARIKEFESEIQSKCEKIERLRGQSSFQCLPSETVIKSSIDENVDGLRSCSITPICNNLQDSKTKPKEVEEKRIDNLIPTKQTFFNGVATFTRQRTSRRLPLKRKRFHEAEVGRSNLQVKTNTNNNVDIEYNQIFGEPPAAAAKLRSAKAASVASSPTTKGNTKQSSKIFAESHVKLAIKSFAIPEFFVDLPESASILTLKRAIIDATMNLLGGGLRVHILMHGKKIIDEKATLLQSGISKNLKPESLGFMLEPSSIPTSPTTNCEDQLLVLSRPSNQTTPWVQGFGTSISNYSHSQGVESGSQEITYGKSNSTKVMAGCSFHDEDPSFSQSHMCGVDQEASCISRKKNTTTISYSTTCRHDDQLKGNNPIAEKATTTKSNLTERIALSPHLTRIAAVGALAAIRAQADANRRLKNDLDTPLPSNNHTLLDGSSSGSSAIILHPTIGMRDNVHRLALVPMQSKSHSLDIGKRRVRRPFSVAEVEALVRAVEKLGTGRWRDVKLRAFEQAKHRTYVDLKDKWKTLVHTARIAPHQRRGEPVPQELLERVIHAHTYWTAQVAKQQAELDF